MSSSTAAASSPVEKMDHLPNTFGLWSGISVGWLTLNVFGGMSFIIFVGLSAGGIPTVLYGFIGSAACCLCIILTFAQCASRFSTAGGAYHYATFLTPEKYRRQSAYFLGWLNYLGWVFTHAACCGIVAQLTLGLVNLCMEDFDVSTRWQLFLVYMAVASICWVVNLFGLRGIPTLEILGCWATVLGFLAFTIWLLVKAPKASARFVFVDTNNDTGYSSTSLAILLGLFNSFATLMGLDAPAHLAEELPRPKVILPRIMLIVLLSQTVVGVVWIIVLGFSITDLAAVRATTTDVPVLELVRLATGSKAAAVIFCVLLMVNNGTSALGSAVAASRQGYAFARDGGLFWNDKLTRISPTWRTPVGSICLPSVLVALIGLIYLGSSAAFNAIIGSQVVCMIISFGWPAGALLFTRRALLPRAKGWNFGRLSNFIYGVSVLYTVLAVITAFIPQVHPVAAETMNYTILVIGVFAIAGSVTWWVEGRKLFSPPVNEEDIAAVLGTVIVGEEGEGLPEDEESKLHGKGAGSDDVEQKH